MTEGVKKYEPMFSAFRDESGKIPSAIQNRIRSIELLMKREDRIVWALRWERYIATQSLPDSNPRKSTALKKFGAELGNPSPSDVQTYHEIVRDHMAHWNSLESAKLNAYVFDRQSPGELFSDLVKIEDEWKASRKQVIRHSEYESDDEDEDDDDDDYRGDWEARARKKAIRKKGEIYKVIDFGDGWAWWNLNRTYCEKEADAMGHCGNKPSAQEGDEVLSLRYDMGKGEFRPSLTFILHKDGMLGEMKGRANEKPSARYHKMIVALLMSEHITGIDGGGYAAQNNFSIDDLPKELRDRLVAEKPLLYSLDDRMMSVIRAAEKGEGGPEIEANREFIIESVGKKLKRKGFRYEDIDFTNGHADIIIRTWDSREAYVGDAGRWNLMDNLSPLFDTLPEVLEDHGIVDDPKLAEDIAYKARAEYFDEVFDSLIYYAQDGDYILSGVNIKVDDRPGARKGKVVVSISLRDFLNPSAEGEDGMDWDDDHAPVPVLDRISSLDDQSDGDRYFSWSDIEHNIEGDDISVAIAKATFENDPLPNSTLYALASEFGTDDASTVHYHSRHPDQLNLDLGDR